MKEKYFISKTSTELENILYCDIGRVQNNYLIILDSSYVFTYFKKKSIRWNIFSYCWCFKILKKEKSNLYIFEKMVHTICWKVEKRPNLTKDSTAIFQKHWPHCDVLQRCRNLRVRGYAMVPQSPTSLRFPGLPTSLCSMRIVTKSNGGPSLSWSFRLIKSAHQNSLGKDHYSD